jgi:Flp pilus assembly protein TadD
MKGAGMNFGKLGRLTGISGLLAIQLLAGAAHSVARDLKVSIPKRDVATPTQKLNREGVAQLKRGHQEKAKRLFYRAYLLDPQDPFTLNNLGYISELEGDADHALRYYALAAREHTDAIIDRSSDAALKGKPLDEAFRHVQDSDQQVSKVNEEAIVMLQKGNVFEARNVLRSELSRHPQDPFLLNNLGYALESIGDVDGALRSYSAAASLHSTKQVIVTPRAKWRGRPISEVAAANAAAVSEQISRGEGIDAASARLNLRGVAALNDNNPSAAREFFLQAYKQDSDNSFTLNNLGYVSELAGDREAAEMYYEAARSGHGAKEKVTYSTRRDAEGGKIDSLADNNKGDVESTLKAIQAAKRRANGPIELKRRDGLAPTNPQESTPVPPVSIETPKLPPLPLPSSEQDRNAAPNPQSEDSSSPQVSPPQNYPPQNLDQH